MTHALAPGSPALDAGDDDIATGLDFDQRGDGFPRIFGDTVDIGAFESQETFLQLVSSDPAMDTTGVGTMDSITLTFDGAITAGTGSILVRSTADGSTLQTIPISSATINGDQLTFTIDVPFNTPFYIQIPEGVITGPGGQRFALSDPAALAFSSALPENTYVDSGDDFVITNDQGTVGTLDDGDSVTWKDGTAGAVTRLTFGTNAFISVQQGINGVAEGGTVFIAAGEYLEGDQMTIDQPVTLQGDGAHLTNLTRDTSKPAHRIIRIRSNASDVTIDGLNISNGFASSDFGGGIQNEGVLDLINSVVSGNKATDGAGGILNQGTCSITNSTIRENSASSGGGILNARNLTIRNSALISNTSSGAGGGISNVAPRGRATVLNTTFSDNTAQFGGGIANRAGGVLTLRHSTLKGNRATSATSDGSGISNSGGGFGSIDAVLNIEHTILNQIGNLENFGDVNSFGYNISSDDTGPNNGTTDLINTDPQLGSLSDNGGPTLTHALVTGSPALNGGTTDFDPNAFTPPLTTDQRGAGFDRVVNGRVDIGAFEAANTAPELVFTGGSLTGLWGQLGADITGDVENDNFGNSVSMSADGQTVIIGSPQTFLNGDRGGYARVFTYDPNAGAGEWIQLGNDINGEAEGDASGTSVSLSADGRTAIIGAPSNEGNGNSAGHARIFVYDRGIGDWVQLGSDLDGDSPGGRFGWSVSLNMDGRTAIVGAPQATFGSRIRTGSAKIFRYDAGAADWVQLGNDIEGLDSGGQFGYSVSLSSDGETAVGGAIFGNGFGNFSGKARVFSFDGSDWTQLGDDIDGEAPGDNLGYSVALSGDGETAVIGAPENDGNGNSSGHARIFRYDGSAWIQLGEDINGAVAVDRAGRAVAVSADGSTILIGSPFNDDNERSSGHGRVYRYDPTAAGGTGEWVQLGNDIRGDEEIDTLGRAASLSADGRTAILGGLELAGIYRLIFVQNYTVPENTLTVTDVDTNDDLDTEGNGLTYSLSGTDSDRFTVDENTGVLSFATAPDFENPTDNGGDNIYNFVLTVTDSGGLTDTQELEITVSDDLELLASSPAMDSVNIAPDSEVTLTFEQNIRAGTGNILIRSTADGSVLQTIAIGDTTIDGSTLSFVLDVPGGQGIYVDIQNGVIEGTGGQPFSLTDPAALAFTTEPPPELVYVDAAEDFTITNDQGTIGTLDNGDTVTWNGTNGAVSGLIFGEDAFTTVQAGIDAVAEDGTVFIAAGEYFEGAEILIEKSLTLLGDGADLTNLTRDTTAAEHRIIQINPNATEVNLEGLTISNGMVDQRIGGGGILHLGESLNINLSTVRDNTSLFAGGGITTFEAITITNSTIVDNTAELFGGGVIVNSRNLTLTNSTMSGNTARRGGGLFNSSISTSNITNSTLKGNTATESSTSGGGIYNNSDGFSRRRGIVNIGITVFDQENNLENRVDGGFAGTVNSLGYNISSDSTGPNNGTTDRINTDPHLGSLSDNGGPTLTHALLTGSPAIDGGDPDFDPNDFTPPLTTDQRGAGFERVVGGRVDVGAFEVQNTAPVITLNGQDPTTIECGTGIYEELAAALDAEDGNLTGSIVITGGPVSPGMPGTFTLTYNVTDSGGLAAATVTRTVNVVDTTAPVISLVGNDTLMQEAGTSFTDPGTNLIEACDTALTVTIGGDAVDVTMVGDYVITYNATDASSNAAAQVTRTVQVRDTIAPVVTLNGSASITLTRNVDSYTEPGATATDSFDPDVEVVIGGDEVNTAVVGDYVVTYDATDDSGNAATQVTRTVKVVETPTFSIAPLAADVTEGAAGETVPMTFTITRAGTTTAAGSVDYVVQLAGSVTAEDFSGATSGTVQFAANGTTATITLQVAGDGIVELDETVTVNLANATPTGAEVNAAGATGTIRNDDTAILTLASVAEQLEGDSGSSDYRFTLTSSAAVDTAFTVAFASEDGTATAGSDFTAVDSSLNFTGTTAGEALAIAVAINGDVDLEQDEVFELILSTISASGRDVTFAGGATDLRRTAQITNDDSASFSIGDVQLAEGDSGTTAFSFTVTLTGSVRDGATVDFTPTAGSANASDATFSGGTLTFSGTDGETQQAIVQVNGDTTVETDETFQVTLSNPQAAGLTVALGDDVGTGTITNDDASVVTIADVSQVEGDSGTSEFVFTLTSSNAVDTGFTVDYSTADGTAAAGEDYTSKSGTASFTGSAGETQEIRISVNGDETVEDDETFLLNLPAPVIAGGRNVSHARTQATGTIRNDDGATVSILPATADEADGALTFSVTSNAQVTGGFTLDYATADGTAEAGSDYSGNNGTLTFAGTTGEIQNITMIISDDAVSERDETFSVNLSNIRSGGRNVEFSSDSAIGTILNDDLVSVSIAGVSQAEGDSGNTTFSFVVTPTGVSDASYSLSYSTADGTAVQPGDYTAANGTLTFAAGSTSPQTITVNVLGDEAVETDEIFTVQLAVSDAMGRSVRVASTGLVQGEIQNDDSGELAIADAQLTEGASGFTDMVFTVTSSATVPGGFAVDFSTAAGTADAADFTGATGTLNFTGTAGETETIAVPIRGDNVVELNETFTVQLSNIQAGGRDVTLGNPSATGTITNDDTAQIAINDVVVAEGDSGQTIAAFTLTLDAPVDAAVSVTSAIENITTSADDILGTPAPVVFAAGSTAAQRLEVAISPDGTVELDETYFVNLIAAESGGRSVSFSDNQGLGTITNDDAAILRFGIGNGVETDADSFGPFTFTTDSSGARRVDTDVTVDVSFAGSTADETVDFANIPSSLRILAGVNGFIGLYKILGDNIAEGDETIVITLSNLQSGGRDVSFPGGATQISRTITITDDDFAPVGNEDGPYVVAEDGELVVNATNGLLANDTDQDDDDTSLTLTGIVTEPANGDFSANADGSFTYTPDADFFGEDSFVYAVSDGTNTSQGTATITVVEQINIAVNVSALRSVIVAGGDPVAAFTVTATNTGPSNATGVTISQSSVLPAGIVVTSAVPTFGRYTGGVWMLDIEEGETETLTVFVQAANTVSSGVNAVSFAMALTGSDQTDSEAGNDASSAAVSISNSRDAKVTVTQAPELSFQSGLFVSKVRITNNTGSIIPVQRLFVFGLPADVSVRNASGTDSFGTLPAGTPYLLSNQDLAPGASVEFTVEFFRLNRDPKFSPQYAVELLTDDGVTPDAAAKGMTVDRMEMLANEDFLLEFGSQPGAEYAIEYSSGLNSWKRVRPTITATATRTQWIDNGPPKTESHPSDAPQRFYRFVDLTPAN